MNPPAVALIACEVFRAEITSLADATSHVVDIQWLEIGLHDQPGRMRERLQQTIALLDSRDDISAIVLAYGLCGCGAAGLCATRHPLVIARAHDCITVFLGSKETYAERQHQCPDCYYYTPGWNRARRVPGPDRLAAMREELQRRFDPEDVDFLLESEQFQWASYRTAAFIDTGTTETTSEAAYSMACADCLGWRFELVRGDPVLLHDLLCGPWDAGRFLVVPPGNRIVHSPDDRIVRAEPMPP